MRVKTMHQPAFEAACRELAAKAGSYDPDLIVGILSGGGYVGRLMAPAFPRARYAEVALSRPATRARRLAGCLLRWLPTSIVDAMRCREARLLAHNNTHNTKRHYHPSTFQLPDTVARQVEEARRVLIVDDAIDSGETMKTVHSSIKNTNPNATVKVAVLTVTNPRAVINADYALFRDETLLRFPWSSDYNTHRP